MYILLLIIFLSFIISLILIPLVVRLANKYELYDHPNRRSCHRIATPRLGGSTFLFSMIASCYIAASILDYFPQLSKEDLFFLFTDRTWRLSLGLLILTAVGIVDDLIGLGAPEKFTAQILFSIYLILEEITLLGVFNQIGIEGTFYWEEIGFTVFTVLLITNAYNFIDGVDGLASSLLTFSLVFFALLFYGVGAYTPAIVAVSLLGANLAFYLFNVHGKKNRLFMGDTGSLTAGGVLAYLSFYCFKTKGLPYPGMNIIFPISIIFVPCFDAIKVSLVRIIKRHSPLNADKTHIHHLLLALGLSHRQTRYIILSLSTFIAGSTYLLMPYLSWWILLLYMSLIMVGAYITLALLTERKERMKKKEAKALANASSLQKTEEELKPEAQHSCC